MQVRLSLDEARLRELDSIVSKAFTKLSKLQGENQELRNTMKREGDPAEVRPS